MDWRALSVVNLPSDTHSVLRRSHLSDSFLLVILFRQNFDGKQYYGLDVGPVFSLVILPVYLDFPPVRIQSPVKVDVIAPLLFSKNVSSSVVYSLFLDA